MTTATKTPTRSRRKPPTATKPAPPVELVELPIESVNPDPTNVRTDLGDVEKLAGSIAEHGVLEPLSVSPDGTGTWTVIYGHRRLAAAKLAKLATVPCLVRTGLTDDDRLEKQVVENLHREDLTVIQEATAYQRLLELGVSQRQLVAKVGRSQSHISKRLTLLKLPEKVRADVDAGEMPLTDAIELTRLAEHPNLIPIALEQHRQDRWKPLREQVDRCLEGQRKFELRTAKIAELQGQRVKVVDWPKSNWIGDLKGKAIAKGCPARWKHYALDVDRNVVDANGHLAATVDRDGDVVWICTQPAFYEKAAKSGGRTPSKATIDKQEAKEKADRAAKREENKQRRLAAADRLPYLRRIIRSGWGNHPQLGAVAGLVSARFVAGSHSTKELRVACELLELDPDAGRASGLYEKERKALSERAAIAPAEVGVAMAIAEIEVSLREGEGLGYGSSVPLGELARSNLYRLLTDEGYQPATDWERKLLGTTAARDRKSA